MTTTNIPIEDEVLARYARGAAAVEPELCCPTDDYEAHYLRALPREIIEKDYGCGNPSKWARAGDVVVDLGSGAGKACYILSQKVGATGRVIGVDFNDAMLELARKHQHEMAEKIGYANVEFVKQKIQDLSLADESVDLIVSNCVLNLVRAEDKRRLFTRMFRVLKRGGRAVISDIVCDKDPTPAIANDPKLWSGCIAGAFREDLFLTMFEEAGFHGMEILARQDRPWRVIDGVEFRSMTVRAFKGKQGPCIDGGQCVTYRGPWKCVSDDDGHNYQRGQPTPVCRKTHALLTDPHGPYAGQFIDAAARESSSCCAGGADEGKCC